MFRLKVSFWASENLIATLQEYREGHLSGMVADFLLAGLEPGQFFQGLGIFQAHTNFLNLSEEMEPFVL